MKTKRIKGLTALAIIFASTTAALASHEQEQVEICDLEPISFDLWVYQLFMC